jgi:hypothetical protein
MVSSFYGLLAHEETIAYWLGLSTEVVRISALWLLASSTGATAFLGRFCRFGAFNGYRRPLTGRAVAGTNPNLRPDEATAFNAYPTVIMGA